jgi:hypothetical protein
MTIRAALFAAASGFAGSAARAHRWWRWPADRQKGAPA